jgi:hypothetical protein
MKTIIQESDKLSVFYENSVSLQVGQQPLLISVTESSKPKTLWVLRGITFVDVTNEPVIPNFVITDEEFFELSEMLEHKEFDENGSEITVPRTLPFDLGEMAAMVIAMRQWKAAQSESLETYRNEI